MRSRVLALLVGCVLGLSVSAASAQPAIEVGSSLTSLMFHSNKFADTTTLGVPSAAFGLLDPSVYASFFINPNTAIEPKLGFLWSASGGHSDHIVTAAAQFDYFTTGTAKRSPFVFAGAGIGHASGASFSPKYVLVGGGLRLPAGDRLTFRLDAHYTHYTDNQGNAVTVGFSIGGVFHRQ